MKSPDSASRVDSPDLDLPRVALVQACWHREIVDRARDAFLQTLEGLGHASDRIDVFEVPGSLEIPLQAKRLAETGRYAAIVATAFVVDGGIYRHDFVSGTVIDALMRVQLDTGVPILSAVLTPQAYHDHDEHRRFFREHFRVKGEEVAHACARTIENLSAIARMPRGDTAGRSVPAGPA
jgi:6,7-dimethyl-8-ribityllumazine synthase